MGEILHQNGKNSDSFLKMRPIKGKLMPLSWGIIQLQG